MTRTVLIVDDEPGLARLMGEMLQDEGFGVVTATSLAEARRHPGPFDAVVADIRLPNGDGRHLREDFPATPFVVITGWAEQAAAEAEPFFLPKPFSGFQLREKVRQALGGA